MHKVRFNLHLDLSKIRFSLGFSSYEFSSYGLEIKGVSNVFMYVNEKTVIEALLCHS